MHKYPTIQLFKKVYTWKPFDKFYTNLTFDFLKNKTC